jgi:hypothetical protein
MNSSLSDMLGGVDQGSPQPKVKEGNTLATQDSIRKSSVKKSKRGTKKESSKKDKTLLSPEDDGNMENSLSDLLNCGMSYPTKKIDELSSTTHTMDSIVHSKKKESKVTKSKRSGTKAEGSTKKNLDSSLSDMFANDCDDEPRSQVKESVGVSTKDSIQRDKIKKSKRSGKKPEETTKKANLENSLSDLLDGDDDDDDDEEPRSRARESLTVSTKDSIQREPEKASSLLKKASKRGGKRTESKEGSTSLSLRGGPAPAPPSLGSTLGKLGGHPRDFGRQADDDDTFCGLGTVGESELARGTGKNSSNSPKKTKIALPPVKAFMKAAPSPFMMSSNDNSDSEDEEDLFQGFSGSNPFRMPSYQ